jgi:inner membrane protein
MLSKTHFLAGLVVGIFLIQYFTISQPILFLLIFLISTILPDIDTPHSKIGRKVLPLSYMLNLIFGHRGFLHSIWIPLGVVALSFYLGSQFIGLTFFGGYVLHLIVDTLTIGGVKWLGPVGGKVKGLFPTGGFSEAVIFSILLILLALEITKLF